jgi:amino acid adenylation domain-containing protein
VTLRNLVEYLEASAARSPDQIAVVDPAGVEVTYSELNRRADRLAGFLAAQGVRRGDRVGVVLPKGIPAVISLFGIMKAGAAYVPVDYTSPLERARQILADCQIRALIVDSRMLGVIPDGQHQRPLAIVVGDVANAAAAGQPLASFEFALDTASDPPMHGRSERDLAYILYTSGSTGTPKGVLLTHENALSFVEWCSSVFAPTEADRFSSHAPFHFDLSVLDIYVSMKHGATLYLISEELGKNPKELARFIAANQLTIWYSTPSILTLLVQFGNLGAHVAPSLRIVLFAGEVFPIKHLREIKKFWPSPVYYNLYGPTETNVCTFARIPDIVPEHRDVPYAIGFTCAHCRALVLDEGGQEVAAGREGLLYISGPSLFGGYWNRPIENASAFLDRDGMRWYNTGDVVRWVQGEGFVYVGRKDRMVKRRGYRIELGEIERALYSHPQVREAAVVSLVDAESVVKIVAFVSCNATETPSIVELKSFCGTNLPAYMNPDRFVVRGTLPKTSTDKVDYQALRRVMLDSPSARQLNG